MSLCRMSDNSDVYVFEHVDGHYECHFCFIPEDGVLDRGIGRTRTKTTLEMHDHLLKHRAAGDKVPQYALDILKEGWCT